MNCSVNDAHTLLDVMWTRLDMAIVSQHVAVKSQANGLARASLPGTTATDWTVSA